MRAYHNTRDITCRSPYGALELGRTVSLSLELWDGWGAVCQCRLWTEGQGERLLPMEGEDLADRVRYTCTFTPDSPEVVWYHFIVTWPDGGMCRYGPEEGRVGGEGRPYDWEPPSFQLTVYRARKLPDWYKEGIAYQIFPDRFHRGEGWQTLAEKYIAQKRQGPGRVLQADWEAVPHYEKDETGQVTGWEFYGGTLSGIMEKLPYLQELGVTILYINPMFEAASNHRYDTGDHTRIDPMLGTTEEFSALCKAAEEHGIRILLDGVFNHVGCDSRYFNKYGNYSDVGAGQSGESPYRDWFTFREDGSCQSWWEGDSLPDVNPNAPSYQRFIYGGSDAVVRRWLRAGASGWRLDAAERLPDRFVAGVKQAALQEKPDAVVVGEVWEDASRRSGHGLLGRGLLGDELDAATNHPLREALLGFATGKVTGSELRERLESLRENYPPEAFYGAFNLLGGHDKPRLMTFLGDAPAADTLSEEDRRAYKLEDWQRDLAKGRLWLLTLCQMTLPGIPCVYYGDEAGMEGYADPYNRGGFPWGEVDPDTDGIIRDGITLRNTADLFKSGALSLLELNDDNLFGFVRGQGEESAVVVVNRSTHQPHRVDIPTMGREPTELLSGMTLEITEETVSLTLPPLGSAVVYFPGGERLGVPLPKGRGILCHITSLPNENGPGVMGEAAKRFVDFLVEHGQKYWQILPLNPPDSFGSPYAGVSAFAGNPALIDTGEKTLEELFRAFSPTGDYRKFCKENEHWLTPYAVFMALRELHGPRWQDWPKIYRSFSPNQARSQKLARTVRFHQFCQYLFDQQWQELRRYANEKGILILGDIPIYVAADSVDVWQQPGLFMLDEEGNKIDCAGVPPDAFDSKGQLWGNPLYRWDVLEETGYQWWIQRMKRAFSLYDFVRVDHFRGFVGYWAVPEGKLAADGRWMTGPCTKLFEAAWEALGPLPVVAEDLGYITPKVRITLAKCGFPGMDIAEFSGDPRVSYDPPASKLAYTGTHDNQTIVGWSADRYPEEDPVTAAAEVMSNVLGSGADIAIVQLQDALGLDDSARMNKPGTIGANWQWQADWEDFDPEMLALMLHGKKPESEEAGA